MISSLTGEWVRSSTPARSACCSIRPCSAAPAVTQCLPVSLAVKPRQTTRAACTRAFHDTLISGSDIACAIGAGSRNLLGRSLCFHSPSSLTLNSAAETVRPASLPPGRVS